MFNIAENYGYNISTLLITVFYAYLIPGGIILSLAGVILNYWTDKYLLIRRCAKPPKISAELSSEMIDFFIESSIIVYSVKKNFLLNYKILIFFNCNIKILFIYINLKYNKKKIIIN